MNDPKPIVLVLCTGNSARSQMAEAFLRKYHGDRYEPHSAGTDPKPHVHPLVVQAMNEVGIDLSGARPKHTDEFIDKVPVKHLIIVCDNANQSCPRSWPGTYTRQFIPFDDPAAATGTDEEKFATTRRIRDEIDRAMHEWSPPAK